MSHATPTATCTELVSLLTAANIANCVIFPHDPTPGLGLRQATITVTFEGMDPTVWLIAVRLYVGADIDVAGAENTVQTLLPQLDALLPGTYTRGTWSRGYHADLAAIVCECTFRVTREDF